MAKHSITAIFDTRAHAEAAVSQLQASGIPASDITSLPASGESGAYADITEARGKGFWSSLEQLFGGTEDQATYAEGIRRGGIVVSVRAEDAQLDEVIDVLERHGSVDLDERETTWRGEGWTGDWTATGSPASSMTDRSGLGIDSPGMAAGAGGELGAATLGAGALGAGALGTAAYEERRAMAVPAATVAPEPGLVAGRAVTDRAATGFSTSTAGLAGQARATDEVIQVVEERLDVGKRSVNRGKVRIHTSVVSREVSEDVTLHDELVRVERRPVDRPVSAAAFDVDPFKERTIEAEEYAEEVVVAKSAHVVEEIGIRKEAADRVETVHDTLRSTRVDIEDGRADRTVTGGLARFAGEIRDDMEVVGSDGAHVGTVDHMDGGRIKLKKIDPSAGGEHHYLETGVVRSVADKVMLAVTAAEAKAGWAKA